MFINPHYEIAATVISLVLILFFSIAKKTRNFQNTTFFLALVLNGISAVSDIIVFYFRSYYPNQILEYTFSYVYLSTHVAVVIVVFFYFLANAREWYQVPKALKLVYLVPLIAVQAYILLDTLTFHTTGKYFEDGSFERGSGMLVLYGVTVFYLINIILALIIFRRSYPLQKRAMYVLGIVVVFAGMLFQGINISFRLETFAVAIDLTLFFYFFQNPYKQIDRETRLFNKIPFYETMRRCIATKEDVDIVALVIQDFEEIMRNNSKEENHSVACQIADFLKSINDSYTVYRVEKNLFVLSFKAKDDIEIVKVEKKLHDRFKQPWIVQNYQLNYKVHICHVPVLNRFANVEGVMGFIYETLNSNFDREILGVQDFNLNILERGMKIKAALMDAIENDKFELTFSPIYSAKLGKINGFEISSRFYDSELGYVSETELMKYVENSGQMIKLGMLLFDKACNFISSHDFKKLGISFVGIKIRSVICLQYEFIGSVNKVFSQYDIDPSFICFQISEYIVSKVSHTFEAHMDILSSMGFQFCLDDYGSGFTNLASIYEYPIKYIKIDSKVVRAMEENEKAKITIESTLDLAKELSMKTIMGGISTEEEFEMVSEFNCDYEIGSYFYVDLDEVTFMRLLNENAMLPADEEVDLSNVKKNKLRTLTSNVASRLFGDNKDPLKPV